MTTKNLETELQETNKQLDDNVKALQIESIKIKKTGRKRKRKSRNSFSSGRILGG